MNVSNLKALGFCGLATAGVVLVSIVSCRNRETTTWSTSVPTMLLGRWELVKDSTSDNFGVRSIVLTANVVVLNVVLSDDELEQRRFDIQKVSETRRHDSVTGSVVIFCGEPDAESIAKNRMLIHYGPKQTITVQDIVPTGSGDDHYFDVGEFVKLD
jgi:hypothetical protein